MGRCDEASKVSSAEGRQRIAIIGSGIAGQTAAYFLKTNHDVVAMYEAAPRPGLHTHSIQMEGLGAVDVPLRAFSPHYYPNLSKLYSHLGVKSQSVNYSSTGTHYNNGQSYFQYYNYMVLQRAVPFVWGEQLGLLSWKCTARIVWDLLWFVATGTYFLYHLRQQREKNDDDSSDSQDDKDKNKSKQDQNKKKYSVGNITLGTFLRMWNFSYEFVHYFLYPVMSTLLSCSYAQVDAYPAEFILQFYSSRSTTIFTGWNKVPDGVETVSNKLLESLGEGVLRLDTKVMSLKTVRDQVTGKKQVQVTTIAGEVELFDHVIIATESSIAKYLWAEEDEDNCVADVDLRGDCMGTPPTAATSFAPTPKKGSMLELLTAMDSFTAEIVVHHDLSLMPAEKERWSGMNYFSFPSASINCGGKVDTSANPTNGEGNTPPPADSSSSLRGGAVLTENFNASMTSVWVNRYVKQQNGERNQSETAAANQSASLPKTTIATRGGGLTADGEAGDVFQSWNPYHEPHPDTVVSRANMTRAVWTVEGKAAFERCFAPNQGKQNIWLCGSYASPGVTLLENAVCSALELALDFGVAEEDLPFKPEPCYQSSRGSVFVGYCVFYWKTIVSLFIVTLLYMSGFLVSGGSPASSSDF